LLVIDNYDSFTYNLVQYLGELGQDVQVRRNNQITVDGIESLRPERIVISPGPGDPRRPQDFGRCPEVLENARTPVLGVCLGHQGIGVHHQGRLDRAPAARHGQGA